MIFQSPMKSLKIFFLLFAYSLLSKAVDLQKLKSDSVALLLSNQLQVRTPMTLSAENISIKDNREFHELTFSHPASGTAKILISGPVGFSQAGKVYPVLFVMSGFQTGAQSLALIGDPGEYVLVGYQYPYTAEEMLEAPERLSQSFILTIGQVVGLWKWLSTQAWADAKKISTLGVSLGSLFMPVSLRVAEFQKFTPYKVIFAFGGADVTSVIVQELSPRLPESARAGFSNLVENATNLIAPKTHLSYLKGSFLVIRGLRDEVFPKESGEQLENLLPQPKTIVHLDTKHINVDTYDIIQPTIKAIYSFLLEN